MRKNDPRFNRPKPRKVSGKKMRAKVASRPMKMKVKKGDTVKVISGKDKGKTGEVTMVMPKTGKILVEGIAVAKRSLRSSARGQSGRIVERPMPIDASNVAVTSSKKKEKTVKAKEVKAEEKAD
jgi:large subunit ribosomal protein L24